MHLLVVSSFCRFCKLAEQGLVRSFCCWFFWQSHFLEHFVKCAYFLKAQLTTPTLNDPSCLWKSQSCSQRRHPLNCSSQTRRCSSIGYRPSLVVGKRRKSANLVWMFEALSFVLLSVHYVTVPVPGSSGEWTVAIQLCSAWILTVKVSIRMGVEFTS